MTNNSDKARSLNITGYAEFTNNSNYEQDQVNLRVFTVYYKDSICGEQSASDDPYQS